jgi:hypothetical protein
MARKQRTSRKHRMTRKHKRGGAGAPDPSSYSSAATYGMAVNGTTNSQFERVFSQTGPDAAFPSNQSVGVQGQNVGYSPSNAQKGGSRKKKGGFWGQILNQALVPFTLLGMQQTYRRKRQSGTKKSFKH